MGRWIPVEVLEHAGHPAFISNEEGRVEYCNAAAISLLELDRRDIEGRLCCEVLRLRSPEGRLLCRAQCAVQSQARDGRLETTRHALITVNGHAPKAVELLAVAVSPPDGRRIAVLHVLKMSALARTESVDDVDRVREPAEHARLSPREREVLRHLARGETTDRIADELFVSRATVRNHVRAILSKLNVHSRLEAVVAAVARG
jgi:DNA-binding CsgD family transcriptional regulator